MIARLDKGKTIVKPAPNKLDTTSPPVPSSSSTPSTTTIALRTAKKKRPRAPSSAHEAAESHVCIDTMGREFHSSTPQFSDALTCASARLNTSKKHRI
jgi:hypothetical protein